MRKMFAMLLPALLALPLPQCAQDTSWSKEQIDAAKAKETELRAEGWKLLGNADTLMQALLSHYAKLERAGKGGYEIFGYAIAETPKRSNDMEKLVSQAWIHAKAMYVKQRRSYIVSKAITELKANQKEDFEKFYFESRLNAEGFVRNELKESYSLTRKTPDGMTELIIFYTVSLEEAVASNIKAFKEKKNIIP